jgi:hypothetical protein
LLVGRFVRILLRELVQERLKSGLEFPVPYWLIELPLPRPHRHR